jgi:hypothetical protein
MSLRLTIRFEVRMRRTVLGSALLQGQVDHGAEAPGVQVLGHGLEQIGGIHLLHLDIGIAGDVEGMSGLDGVAR